MVDSKIKTFILCAGNQERFDGFKFPKQLLIFDDETLIARTIRQIRKIGLAFRSVFIVTHLDGIFEQYANVIVPANRKTTCHTIMSTVEHWGGIDHDGRIVILLGDVRYSDDAMEKIYSFDGPIGVFTDTGDIFALSFVTKESFVNQMIATIRHNRSHIIPIREWYEAYRSEVETIIIADETQDFDRPYEYDDFNRGYSKNRMYGKKSPNFRS